MEEDQAFATVSALMEGDALLKSRQESWLILGTFEALLLKYLKKVHEKLTKMKTSDSQPLAGFMTDWIFYSLPASTLHHLIDNFLVKGQKIIYRFAMAIVQRWYKAASIDGQTIDFTPQDIAAMASDNNVVAAEAFAFK